MRKQTHVSLVKIDGCGLFRRRATSWPGSSEHVVYERLSQTDSRPVGRFFSAASFLFGLAISLVGAGASYLL